MDTAKHPFEKSYASCIEVSKRVRWDEEELKRQAVEELIGIVADFDSILAQQSAYRKQYIFSGVDHPRFQAGIADATTPGRLERVGEALAGLRPQ